MLYCGENINILSDGDTVVNTEILKQYFDISKLNVKSMCADKREFGNYYMILVDDVILFITYKFASEFHNKKCTINCIVKLINIDAMFVEINKIDPDINKKPWDPSLYILSLYALDLNNRLTLTNIRVGVNSGILREYKIIESKFVDLFDISHIKPLNNIRAFAIYTNDKILLMNKTLEIFYEKQYVSKLNVNQMIINEYLYVYVVDNEIFIYDVVTNEFLFSGKPGINIKSLVDIQDCILYTLDYENNLYAHRLGIYHKIIHPYKNVLNVGNNVVQIHNVLQNVKIYYHYIVLNNGKIYLYFVEENKLSISREHNNKITYVENQSFVPHVWSKFNHVLFDKNIKNNICTILLCNKVTLYRKICRPLLYKIFVLLCVI